MRSFQGNRPACRGGAAEWRAPTRQRSLEIGIDHLVPECAVGIEKRDGKSQPATLAQSSIGPADASNLTIAVETMEVKALVTLPVLFAAASGSQRKAERG